MMVDRACREVRYFCWFSSDLSLSFFIGKRHHRVRIRHIECISHQCHAKGRIQPLQEYRAELCRAISICIPQEHNAVGTWHAASGLLLKELEEKALDAFGIIRPLRGIGFRDKYISIRKHI